jgi:hypothetical protein
MPWYLEALPRVLLALAQAAEGVGEVDRAVLLDDDVVRAVELLAFVALGEHVRLPSFSMRSIDLPPRSR